jgi:hypothetical protein
MACLRQESAIFIGFLIHLTNCINFVNIITIAEGYEQLAKVVENCSNLLLFAVYFLF